MRTESPSPRGTNQGRLKSLERVMSFERLAFRRPRMSSRRSLGACQWTVPSCSSTAYVGTRAHFRRPSENDTRYRSLAV